MQSHQPPQPPRAPQKTHAPQPHTAPKPRRFALPPMSRRTRIFVIAGAAVVGTALLALLLVNLLISADWVRDRVAARIKEQTGRDLQVNGTTAILFAPGPKVIISDAVITDPEERAGTADLSVGRLVLDLSFGELLSRQIDAERVVLVRPVLTFRLGGEVKEPKKPKPEGAKDPNDRPRREIRLRDIQIEDGAINIVYDDKGTERRIENIAANLALPALAAPFTGRGTFEWKDQTVDFSFELTSPAELRQKRPAKLVLALDTKAISARFDGNVSSRPIFSGQGKLSAKAHSIPSLLAWMRERPAVSATLGDGELASDVAWTKGEITLSNVRFALEHANGQGQAVVTLQSPRPHIRAALALDHLNLNPFLVSGRRKPDGKSEPQAAPSTPSQAETAVPRQASPDSQAKQDWFSKPAEDPGTETAPPSSAPVPEVTADIAPQPAPAAEPASFDADVNLNVRRTRLAHLEFGPSSLGLVFRDGILNATLGGMELYEGRATGKLVLDASRAVPSFTGDFHLDGVQAKSLLSDAAQISLLEGETKLALQISGAGDNSEAIKSSLQGQGSLAVSDGAIEGINLTEMITRLGEGEIPDMRQGPGAKTAFSELGGSFTIAGGIAETSNLQITSPLLKVAASGNVDLTQNSINMLAESEIVAGPEGASGANDLAGLSLPVRIEGPLDRPVIRPEVKAMFANPEKAGKAVNKIGKALEKKFKGKPVGEAIGRLLGNVQIGTPDEGDGDAPSANRQRAGRKENPKPTPPAAEAEPKVAPEPVDPDLDRILR
ncbi:MAG TPA: AsmA family protein [Methyloceanibacter sp.]|nr:AsmA family protein [Methyloceanibacter sp.]